MVWLSLHKLLKHINKTKKIFCVGSFLLSPLHICSTVFLDLYYGDANEKDLAMEIQYSATHCCT